MPKPSSTGLTANALGGSVFAGSGTLSVAALAAETVKVPAPATVSATLQEFDGARVGPQSEAMVWPLATSTRPVAVAEPRLRTIRLGALSAEMLRLDALAAVES